MIEDEMKAITAIVELLKALKTRDERVRVLQYALMCAQNPDGSP